jgi:RNA polymerase sigma factor (sigma-70 family)
MRSAEDRTPPAQNADGSDAELLRRISSADAAAFEDLYDLYGSVAYGVAVRITFDEALAEDIVQEAFTAVWRHAAQFDPRRGSVKTWLLSIVHHRAIDEVRRRRNLEALPEQDDDDAPAALTLPDVWSQVAQRFDVGAVRDAFGQLPEAQREVLLLAYYEGLTNEQIAARTSAPLGTVKGRIRLGLLHLRRALVDDSGPLEFERDAAAGGRAATASTTLERES